MSNVSIDFSVACHFNAFELAFNEKSMTLFIHLHHECRPGMFCGIHTQGALLSLWHGAHKVNLLSFCEMMTLSYLCNCAQCSALVLKMDLF